MFKRKYFWSLIIVISTLILFYPSFNYFYTNDDFFVLNISKPSTLGNFLSYFDITRAHQGFTHFRPLTTQVFFTLAWLFNLSPIPLRIIMFAAFLITGYLIYKLVTELGLTRKMANMSVFLYMTSATNFGRLYSLSTQEFGYTIFVLLSVILLIKYLKQNHPITYYLSLITFILALASKETAIVTPFLLLITFIYLKYAKKPEVERKLSLSTALKLMFPYFLLLAAYLYFRIFHYGFASGDSYIWDFSPRVVNTIFWYGSWSLNVPEMLVDFIGPGFHINPNLFKFWSDYMIPICILFIIEITLLVYMLVTNFKKFFTHNSLFTILYSAFFFLVSLTPVLFLPLHKFTFYLTLPLVGFVIVIAFLLSTSSQLQSAIYLIVWFFLSFITLNLTSETNWITQGEKTAKRVNAYFQNNGDIFTKYDKIVFIDTPEDLDLPWKPSQIIRTTLSDQNYFYVYYPGNFRVYYGNDYVSADAYEIKARQFIGY
ncbi:hypothetical protein A3A76_03725 [Candidatus Woesebacteria bacterium RIFCSPLOWO2_01_FULL_39_23]|uniref:Glycosyltransferase RgtA/B/C/D-like domain-containing protein n=1 Tax=Candidatus Woesebacteria bacterium RIFCSPHIGHO2_01_FULL_40_22 TaxID=1802499 RepID=A0A1F7YJU2_9BACT|nr:MAG: hypothetical protein A2141_00300 [Candidatus Woesebacteria bacterium RBG_16_40_11]OGM27563.1 MAG: hypothetical protein A2628_02125 [Candidatus Woesebacteria bacterium RIFCSPHIGHO2_01_FULL_40_22]OGM36717.1 MAG: hypothetical protein A3E41_02970 [Candidatus Woesebacteria bacterium RIFCSPHIGHO2_12_FULL_38_9]OGM62737.1 MAG: hypothetical protein A3A76_03725 [Candidatus Woesebacteria bacterium RIFCSPLOWO2_01_FULL_39_23]